MNIKIKDLTASDFPGIDEAKFNEWKALKIKRNREQRIPFYIGVGILLILSLLSLLTANPIFLLIFLIWFIIDDVYVLIFLIYRRRYRHLRQLGKELKMSARLRAKKKGKEFTG
jgi:predicted membrane channel-forming protein YqfA (hemolysin III family)